MPGLPSKERGDLHAKRMLGMVLACVAPEEVLAYLFRYVAERCPSLKIVSSYWRMLSDLNKYGVHGRRQPQSASRSQVGSQSQNSTGTRQGSTLKRRDFKSLMYQPSSSSTCPEFGCERRHIITKHTIIDAHT
jgi:hypothetical protein